MSQKGLSKRHALIKGFPNQVFHRTLLLVVAKQGCAEAARMIRVKEDKIMPRHIPASMATVTGLAGRQAGENV